MVTIKFTVYREHRIRAREQFPHIFNKDTLVLETPYRAEFEISSELVSEEDFVALKLVFDNIHVAADD